MISRLAQGAHQAFDINNASAPSQSNKTSDAYNAPAVFEAAKTVTLIISYT